MTTPPNPPSQGQTSTGTATGTNTEPNPRTHFPQDPNLPGRHFEPRQTSPTSDYTPHPSTSLPLSPARQALVSDIITLYTMSATPALLQRIYCPDSVYHDELGYAPDRYQIAGQWLGLPYIFRSATSVAHEVVTNDRDLIQFKHHMEWQPKLLPTESSKKVRLRSLVSLALDPATVDGEGPIRVKYHKDQASAEDYSNEGVGARMKKWQAEGTAAVLSLVDSDLREFVGDKGAGGEKKGQ